MCHSVARTVMGRATISTVQVDLYARDTHPYETMIFQDGNNPLSDYQSKSSTLQEARHDHVLAIQYLLMHEFYKGESNDNNNDNQ